MAVETDTQERLATGYTGRVLLSTSLGNTVVLAAMVVLSPLLPRIIAALGISSSLAGFALSAMWGGAAICQHLGGRSSDVLSRKTVLVAALATLLVACLVLAGATGYPLFVAGCLGVGVAAGLYWPTMFAFTAELFTARRGQAFGILAGSGDVGGLAATGLAAVLLAGVGWRLAFVPIAALALVALVAIHRSSTQRYEFGRVRLDLRETIGHLLATRRLRVALVAFALFLFVYQGATSFLPTLLQADRGLSPGRANAAFAVLWIGGITVKPIAGRVGDRVGHATVAAIAAVAAGVGLAVLLGAPGRLLALAGLAGFALGMAALWPTVTAYAIARFPDASAGGDLGGFRTATYAVGSLGPSYVGIVANRVGYTVAFFGFTACLLAVGGLVGWLAR